jgi:phosphoribosylaminoimidazole-succinocarboxamide synthase
MTQNISNFSATRQRTKRKEIFNGRSKILFEGPDSGTLVIHFKDSLDNATEDNAQLNAHGVINNRFSELMMQRLTQIGIETHLIRRLNMREQLVRAADPLPFRFRVHNIAVDSLVERLDLEANLVLSEPIIELYVRNNAGQEHVVSPQHVYSLGWSQEEELEPLFNSIKRMNDFLLGQFSALNLRLSNYSLEFGRILSQDFFENTKLILIDAFSMDSVGIMDNKTGERLDSSIGSSTNWQGCKEVARRFGFVEEETESDSDQKEAA